jgi:aminoglycoside phosphotransferase family enzyme/predicted kinase
MAAMAAVAYTWPMDDDQRQTIGFLGQPALHDGVEPRHVETHLSHVFIGPTRVLKLKKAIRTNFLDFSTVEARRAMCAREIEVNRVAGDLYRGTRAITQAADGGLCLDGDGPAVDWVVEMRPFDPATGFDRLLENGALTADHVTELADTVARMHAEAPRAPRADEDAHQIARIEQIAGAIRAGDRTGRHRDLVGRWERAALAMRDRHARLIAARGRHGFVRRCHGDLHLGNICLDGENPVPFDAMEFNEDIATTDILYDAAFVISDLLSHRQRRLAADFTGRYLGATRDFGGLPLLPLFTSMRSAVRAIPAVGPGGEGAETVLDQARALLDWRPAPRLIAIGGLSGSGKSTLARRLAAELGAPLTAIALRSDVTRKRLAHARPEQKLARDAYARDMGDRVYRRLLVDARRVLKAGFTCIVDATFLEPARREAIEAFARRQGAPLDAFWLDAAPSTLLSRVEARVHDASDATGEVVREQLAHAPRHTGWRHLEAGDAADAVLARALTEL